MAQEYTSNKDFTGTSTGKRLLDKYLKINPWTRIPTEIIERFLDEKKAKEGFDYVPRGPLKSVEGEGGSGKEYDPVRLPNITIRPSQLTLPLRLPFSPDFIVKPSSPVLTAKKGSRLVSKHLSGGWISWLGQEGVPTLRSLRRYGSYSNPVRLPELVVTAPVPPPVFDRRVRTYPGGHEVISDIIFDYYRNYDGTPSGYYMGDNSPIRGGRLIFTSPRGNDTIWTEPTPTTEDLKAWEEYYGPKLYTGWMDSLYVKPAKDLKKAKQTFYKNVKRAKPSNKKYKEEVNALQRAKKGN